MALHRLLLLAIATLLGAAATGGVQFSTAAYTATSAAPVAVTAANDWTPPAVTMTDPGGALSGNVTVAATASDARSSVADVVILRSPNGSSTWTTICTDNQAPYSCSWATTAVADGTYQLRAVATDTAGYSAISAAVTTAVVNDASVDLATIADVVRGNVPLSITVTGEGGATVTTRVEYALAGSGSWSTIPGCGDANGATRSCTWTTSGAAVYDVRAVAAVGTKSSYDTQAGVRVDNVVPTISQSVPAGTLAGAVVLTAAATDAHSGVASATFQYKLAGASAWADCGVDTVAPYSCTLATSTLANASYDFRSIAADMAGNTATSAVDTRSVDNRAPSVSITAPGVGAALSSGSTTVTADAFAVAGVTSVTIEARISGGTFAQVCVDDSAPYSCPWSTAALTSGAWELRAVMTYGSGSTLTSATVAVTVDNVVLRALDVQALNNGTAGTVEAGDRLVLTYSTLVSPGSIKSGWTGSSTGVAVTFYDARVAGAGTGSDRLDTDAKLGHVTFGQDYVKNNRTTALTGSTMTASTATVNGVQVTVVTITLGAPTASALSDDTATGTMTWFPSTAATTPTGLACTAAAAAESGTTDRDF